MKAPARTLGASEAAKRLGISAKALRLYERRGLLVPARTEAGWRCYRPEDVARGAEIVALRALGLSLAEVGSVLEGDTDRLEAALRAHEATLENQIHKLTDTVGKVRALRRDIDAGRTLTADELVHLADPRAAPVAAFDLPWPWGGERFALCDVRPLNYIIGPLGSGKTRLAMRIAENLPDAKFLGLDRLADDCAAAQVALEGSPALNARVDAAMAWLAGEGAEPSRALTALLVALEADAPAMLVVDLIEQGLPESAQLALIAYLRSRGRDARPIFMITRSSAILDLECVGAGEAIILCPANHSPPVRVEPYPGAPGYEAVATCLAPPAVRARTEGVIAVRAGPAWADVRSA